MLFAPQDGLWGFIRHVYSIPTDIRHAIDNLIIAITIDCCLSPVNTQFTLLLNVQITFLYSIGRPCNISTILLVCLLKNRTIGSWDLSVTWETGKGGNEFCKNDWQCYFSYRQHSHNYLGDDLFQTVAKSKICDKVYSLDKHFFKKKKGPMTPQITARESWFMYAAQYRI